MIDGMASDERVTRLLGELSAGDPSAAGRLLPHVYDELRDLAASFFRQQPANHTLQPTALVHEAYLKLAGGDRAGREEWESRKHFFDVAAMAMRQLLADHARRKASIKRGGDAIRVTLVDSDGVLVGAAAAPAAVGAPGDLDVEALDAALTKLSALDPRQGRIVELRFLAGLTSEQIADILGISERTVRLEWQTARAWLRRELAD